MQSRLLILLTYTHVRNLFAGDSIKIPTEEHRKDLTPKLAYEMSLKFLERQSSLKSLIGTLDEHKESLSSQKIKILEHLERLNKDEQ